MKVAIEEALQVLIGLHLTAAGRAASLEWFHFGEDRCLNGETIRIATYALHVQTDWRITSPKEIEVGSDDRYFAAGGDPFKDYPDFDWDRPGANRCDERMAAFLERHTMAPLTVQAIQADALGSVRLWLSQGSTIDIFPNTSFASELWRLFQPGTEEQHVVVTAAGVGH